MIIVAMIGLGPIRAIVFGGSAQILLLVLISGITTEELGGTED